MSDHLFCYGTLLESQIMRMVIGKEYTMQDATLLGYSRYLVKGGDYPGVVQNPQGEAEGKLCLGVTSSDLKKLDRFEGELYRRQLVRVKAPYNRTVNAWCYVVPRRSSMRLSKKEWSLEEYRMKILKRYNLSLEP